MMRVDALRVRGKSRVQIGRGDKQRKTQEGTIVRGIDSGTAVVGTWEACRVEITSTRKNTTEAGEVDAVKEVDMITRKLMEGPLIVDWCIADI